MNQHNALIWALNIISTMFGSAIPPPGVIVLQMADRTTLKYLPTPLFMDLTHLPSITLPRGSHCTCIADCQAGGGGGQILGGKFTILHRKGSTIVRCSISVHSHTHRCRGVCVGRGWGGGCKANMIHQDVQVNMSEQWIIVIVH